MNSRLTAYCGSVFASVLLLFVVESVYAGKIQPGDNQSLPDIRWTDVDGRIHHLKDSDGKPRLLHFWAAWCVPCRKEMPEILSWQRQNRGVLVIPLSLDQRMAQARHFIKRNKLNMSALLVNAEDSKSLGVPAVPYTFLVSSDGRLVGHITGIAPWLDATFSRQLLRELSQATSIPTDSQ